MIDKFDGRYRFLSNFYPCEIEYKGIKYPSNEHFYIAMKINSIQIVNGVQMAVNDVRDYISKMGDPAKAKRFGRTLKLRSDWDDVRLKVMEYGLREKFLKNDDLKELLLQTGNEELVEGNWWGDVFFGVCKGVGENHLGKLLMKIRDEIKQSQTKIPLKF